MPAPNDDVLTLDSALGLMSLPADEAGADFVPDEDNSLEPLNSDIDDNDQPSREPAKADDEIAADASDKDAPADETASDEAATNDEEVDQGDDALPPIEAPSSWKTEEKAVWDALPRKAQEAISRREQDNTKELRNLQNGSAEQRKAVDAEVGKLKALTGQIDVLLNRDVEALSREFPEIRSEADVVALSISDPARYSVFDAKLKALNSANQTREAVAKEVSAKEAKAAEEAQTAHFAEAKGKLLEAFPAWKDLEVAKRETTELQDYAIKQGAPEAAARSTVDPVIYKLAQKAMLYDRALAAKQKSVQRVPPRTVKPGNQSGSPKQAAREDARRTQLARLDETGSIEDAMGLLRG